MKIKQITELLSINNNIELIGSNSLNKLKYATDYDLQEHIKSTKTTDKLAILTKIQAIFLYVNKTKNIFITDFKSGVFNGNPVRWTYDDVMNGYQNIDTKHVELIDTFYNIHNTVKIDIIALVNKEFVEFSCNYYFSKSKFDMEAVLLSLMLDIRKYYLENKFMKMMKRIMSYRLIKNENIDDITKLFNSNSGKLYQLYHKIDVVNFVLEEHLDFDLQYINDQINNIMHSLPDDVKNKIKPRVDIIDLLNEIKNILMQQMNNDVIAFINSDNNL